MSEFEKLLESGLLDEESKKAIQEALNEKVSEKLEEHKETLREEFARRYEHDKRIMIEAADQMFNESLRKELEEFNEDRQSLVQSKVNYRKMIKEHAKIINNFITKNLHKEIKELREDRKQMVEALQKFEKFAVKHISEELSEFHEDKKNLVETKVNLIKKANGKIEESRKEFVKRAALVTEKFVEEKLRNEIGTFRKDIKEARKNNFGRKIFEAFAADFMASHLSDGTQIKKLAQAVRERESALAEAEKNLNEHKEVIQTEQKKRMLAESKLIRHKKMNELLSPLPRAKKELMSELLENVETKRLDEAFKKHIKYVLSEDNKTNKVPLSEGKTNYRSEVTGNKKSEFLNESTENNDELLRFKKLAGI